MTDTVGIHTYTYDSANRLTVADGAAQTWDNNGNLLSDGTRTYAYDSANRPITITQGSTTYTFAYNGLGDRTKQTVNSAPTNYALDLNAGLTQVLADGTNTYLYGPVRIAQYAGTTPSYFLPDALGSVRQLADANRNVTLARSYQPYGSVMSSVGSGTTSYAFTGEWQDATNLLYLRARYYASWQGRFISADSWPGSYTRPMTLNKWLYTEANPINWVDPSGQHRWYHTTTGLDSAHEVIENFLQAKYGNTKIHLEYATPGPRKVVDVIFFPTADTAELAFRPKDRSIGYVYEIEPYYGAYMVVKATNEAKGKTAELIKQAPKLWGPVHDADLGYLDTTYSWTNVTWMLGSRPLPPNPVNVPYQNRELIVWYAGQGAIMFWDPDNDRQKPPPIIASRRKDQSTTQACEVCDTYPIAVNNWPIRVPEEEAAKLIGAITAVTIIVCLPAIPGALPPNRGWLR